MYSALHIMQWLFFHMDVFIHINLHFVDSVKIKIKSIMVTRRQNSASSVVGLIYVTDMMDNWRAIKSIMSERKTMFF